MRRIAATLIPTAMLALIASSAHGQLPPLSDDHLLGYKAGADKKAVVPGAPLSKGHVGNIVDQFGSHGTCAIKKEKALYVPADKNGEGIQDATRHYIGYSVSCNDKHVDTRTYFDQIFPSGVEVSAVKEQSILIPAGKSTDLPTTPTPPVAGTNRYLCYKAKAPSMSPVNVTLGDQFGAARQFALTKISAVCNPADKDGDDPSAATDVEHYVCYKAKPAASGTPPSVRTNTIDYGANTLASKKEFVLCIPAFKDAVPTTTTTMGACGGGPFSCGGACAPGGTCAPISDFPPYCGCVPDGSQACNSVDFPYCNGQCAPGESCGSEAHIPGAGCICVASPPACGESSYPTCGGACDAGRACSPFFVSGINYTYCACAPAAPCDMSCSGSAGGQCPPGQACHVGSAPCGCAP